MSDRAPVFAAVAKHAPGIWQKPGAIGDMDRAIDALLGLSVKPLPMPAPTGSAFDREVVKHLRREEGVRSKAYKDHLGYWTIGVGRLIDSRKGGRITPEEDAILMANDPSRRGKKWRQYVLTDVEIDMLLLNDVARFVNAMSDWPAWQRVQSNDARMVALLSMCFQMGEAGLKRFRNSLRLVERGLWSAAATNFMKSLWAKQTPARARRVTDLIRTGRFP